MALLPKVNAYAAADYAGLEIGEEGADMRFYYGYEEETCTMHSSSDACEADECEEREWAFVATVKGKRVMVVPESELPMTDGYEPTDRLLAGIALYLNGKYGKAKKGKTVRKGGKARKGAGKRA